MAGCWGRHEPAPALLKYQVEDEMTKSKYHPEPKRHEVANLAPGFTYIDGLEDRRFRALKHLEKLKTAGGSPATARQIHTEATDVLQELREEMQRMMDSRPTDSIVDLARRIDINRMTRRVHAFCTALETSLSLRN